MRIANLFWGFLFILLGLLFFFSNLNIITVDWSFILNLWPLLIVFLGIYFLPDRIRSVGVLVLLALITGLFIYAIDFGNASFFQKNVFLEEQSSEYPDLFESKGSIAYDYKPAFQHARLSFKTTAGRYRLAKTRKKLFALDAQHSPWQSFSLNNKQVADTGIAELTLNGVNKEAQQQAPLSLNLHPQPVWDFYMRFGTAKAKLDFSPFKVHKLTISGNEAALYITLARLTPSANAIIHGPESEITLTIPTKAGCRLVTENSLNAALEGFNQQNARTYLTENFEQAEEKLTVKLLGNPGSFKLKRK